MCYTLSNHPISYTNGVPPSPRLLRAARRGESEGEGEDALSSPFTAKTPLRLHRWQDTIKYISLNRLI
jgi:hypothetical protein